MMASRGAPHPIITNANRTWDVVHRPSCQPSILGQINFSSSNGKIPKVPNHSTSHTLTNYFNNILKTATTIEISPTFRNVCAFKLQINFSLQLSHKFITTAEQKHLITHNIIFRPTSTISHTRTSFKHKQHFFFNP